MIGKNIRYLRLQKDVTMSRLASLSGITVAKISDYESGKQKPDIDTIKKLSSALGATVGDLLSVRNEKLTYSHEQFRKGCNLSKTTQEYVRQSVEEYIGRFYTVVEILETDVMPAVPAIHSIPLEDDSEDCAKLMRGWLGLPKSGAAVNLVGLLENSGIIVCECDIQSSRFSGMNGLANGRPYVVYNKNISAERIRSTVAHELAHIVFDWGSCTQSQAENKADAISGAFLLPKEDARRKLILQKDAIDISERGVCYSVCCEYGVSMCLLAKRASICGIITPQAETSFYKIANRLGWRVKEPERVQKEKPVLFDNLVFRAVKEGRISVQKGAELLQQPYMYVERNCFAPDAAGC